MTAYTRWGTRWSGSHYGLMTGILRGEWGNMNMSITDNVLTTYTNGVDAIMAGGVTTFDAMMPYITNQLPAYENDPVVVNAMREACHHNLYALVNSSGMNGVGPNTVVKEAQLAVVTTTMILACAASFFALVGIVLWIFGSKKFKKTPEYAAYKSFLQEQKAAKQG